MAPDSDSDLSRYESTGLAEISVAIVYQHQVHRVDFQVSDFVPTAFVHSLLSEAVEQVRDSLRSATFVPAVPAGLLDKLAQAEKTEPPQRGAVQARVVTDPTHSDLPVRGGQCTALVQTRSRRRACGYQLDEAGTCPMAKHHLGATEEPDPDDLF